MENSQLLELIGKTKTQNLIDDISKQYLEIQDKKFPSLNHLTKALSIVSVTDPNETEIKDIGMSCVNDLLNDNWGKFLLAVIGAGQGIALQDDSDTTRSLTMQQTTDTNAGAYNTTNNPAGQVGSAVQVGKGTAPATRQDFTIENPFVGGVESLKNSTGIGGWNSGLGQVDIATLISATLGAGSISETVLFCRWHVNVGGNSYFLMSRDNISPVVSFIAGQAINVDYKMVFN